MTERLTDLIVGLQRMAENARMRGDDLKYTQQQETYDHIQWLDAQLGMVEKVRAVFLEERKKFVPVERQREAVPTMPKEQYEALPKVVSQGPRPQMSLATKEKQHDITDHR